jgi:hypothetical protein
MGKNFNSRRQLFINNPDDLVRLPSLNKRRIIVVRNILSVNYNEGSKT